nr:PPE family protein [Mycobacterium sp.]
MNYSVLPPEINSALIFSGAGSGPMLAAAAAWDALASELESAANSFSSVTSGLAAQAWQGSASAAMVAAATPYAGWLTTAAAQASGAASQAQAMASAFESALAATVPLPVVAANRSDLVSLVMSNVFGQNAPAIAETESQYEQMWAQDVAAMVGYHGGASAAAAQLASPAEALQNLPGLAQNALNNIGYGNTGISNVGFYNTGYGNIGIGNAGILNAGIGNIGTINTGIGNVSPNKAFVGNLGIGNNGINNAGAFNFGLSNTGIGNTGTDDVGIGLYGNYLYGIGPLSFSH